VKGSTADFAAAEYTPRVRALRIALVAVAIPAAAFAGGGIVADVAGDDWSLPAWVQPTTGLELFSESADPGHEVNLRVVDFTWRQLEPAEGVFSTTGTDAVYGMSFGSWTSQLAGSDPFWMRIWVSGTNWAPAWARTACGVATVGLGYENDPHLPLWNACLWQKALGVLRWALETQGLRANPRLQFLYAPGAFTWCEFDYDIPTIAADAGDLEFADWHAWFEGAMQSLVDILDGENADPGDDYAWKLVYTGEDYPFGPASWGTQDDLEARDAVAKGMGIRTGITELSNFHLNHVPAYGTTIAADGHMTTDESAPALDGRRTVATENECYNDCGFSTADPYYAVKMSNLKALQLRMNRMYVVPGPSYMDAYAEHWSWVRLELGKTVYTAPDAWVALREAEDTYWIDDTSFTWTGAPWVKNLERWVAQRDVAPGAISRRGTDVRTGVLDPTNGTAYEGRRTELALGRDALALFVDPRFLPSGMPAQIDVEVTYRDSGSGSFALQYPGAAGAQTTAAQPFAGSGAWRTVTFRVDDGRWNRSLEGGADLRLVAAGPADLEARFVRLIKRAAPAVVFADGLESGDTRFWGGRVP
jgi:hypothetical protein